MNRVWRGLAILVFGVPAGSAAQTSIGEIRLQIVAGAAPAPGVVTAPADFSPPEGRALAGIAGGLSFIHRALSAGPEVIILRGSDRRMHALGGVARVNLSTGRVRPFVLVGAGLYSWDRKQVPPADPSSGARWVGDKSYLSGNAGGGVIVGARRTALVLEVRAHRSLGVDELFGSRNLFSLSAGGRIVW
jgi:hypothetical protein